MWKEGFFNGLNGNNKSMSFFHDATLEIFPLSSIDRFSIESSKDEVFGFCL